MYKFFLDILPNVSTFQVLGEMGLSDLALMFRLIRHIGIDNCGNGC